MSGKFQTTQVWGCVCKVEKLCFKNEEFFCKSYRDFGNEKSLFIFLKVVT